MDNLIAEYDILGGVQPVSQRGLIPSADLYAPWMSPDPLTPVEPPGGTQMDTYDTGIAIPTVGTSDPAMPDAASSLSGRSRFINPTAARQLNPSLNVDQEEDDHNSHPSLPLLILPRSLIRAPPPPMWCGFDVRGDERREGPIFNYARIFTWFACADHVAGGFETAIGKFRGMTPIPVTTTAAALCCGFAPRQRLAPFAAWSHLRTAFRHMFGAAFVALLLQWGTTGAAIFVAYSTPPVGLGCRSGSYVLYGSAATFSWAMLVSSTLFSHAVMQRLEKDRRRSTGILEALAVITRVTGQAIAIANAGWLIASTVMEDIGTFQNCWCQTNAPQYGAIGWTPVFTATSILRAAAGHIWIGGFIFSMVVCILISLFFCV